MQPVAHRTESSRADRMAGEPIEAIDNADAGRPSRKAWDADEPGSPWFDRHEAACRRTSHPRVSARFVTAERDRLVASEAGSGSERSAGRAG